MMISATIVDNSGRTLSGQTIEAFFVSIKHAKVVTVGINCALGAAQMKGFYKMLTDINPGCSHVCPNAGLPNAMGCYDEDPEIFSTNILDYTKDRLLNFVGGFCGTFPSHIAAVAKKVKDCTPRSFQSCRRTRVCNCQVWGLASWKKTVDFSGLACEATSWGPPGSSSWSMLTNGTWPWRYAWRSAKRKPTFLFSISIQI